MTMSQSMPASAQSDQDLREIVTRYFEALYHGDVTLFREVFHPEARLFSATGGKLVAIDLPQYLAIVAGRPSSASRNDVRFDEFLSLVRSSPTTAHATVKDVYLPKRFVDELTLAWLDGRWQIVSKVWHFEIES